MLRVAMLFVALVTVPLTTASAQRPRVFVLTDISNEPDDEQSLVRFLVYSNEFDVEGIVATTSTWLREGTREDLIRRQIDAYEKVRPNLAIHADGYPTANQLRRVIATGQPGYGLGSVGEGKSSAGSRLLIAAAEKRDDRPLWVCIWGGANTLAQALRDAGRELRFDDFDALVKKLRVYSISDQDDAGAWLRNEFADLFYVVSPSTQKADEYHRATWTGISGDRDYKNGPFHKFELVDNPWLEQHIINDHGPLGRLYPKLKYIMEGDTPSFLGLIDNGLGWVDSPAHGGWGGRYNLFQATGESRAIWTNNRSSRDTVTADNGQTTTSDMATIWRWREGFQHDFAARMDWCIADEFTKANHNPVAIVQGNETKSVVRVTAKPGSTLKLSAEGSRDPDGDDLTHDWFVYREAGSDPGDVQIELDDQSETTLVIPPDAKPDQTIHVILRLQDNGTPKLTSYRRVIVTIRSKNDPS